MILEVISIISVYIIMAILTAIVIYIQLVKKYAKEKPRMSFKSWIDGEINEIIVVSILWFAAIPIYIISFFAKKIIERINKHYGVK